MAKFTDPEDLDEETLSKEFEQLEALYPFGMTKEDYDNYLRSEGIEPQEDGSSIIIADNGMKFRIRPKA